MDGFLRSTGNEAAAEKVLQAAIDQRIVDWLPYDHVGSRLARQSKHDEALEVYLKYPGFEESNDSQHVSLSNLAYEAGSLLYWAGAYQEARPLYELAAGYQTGSSAGMSSRARLALIDGDYQLASTELLNRAQRYGSKYAIKDFVGLLILLGANDDAWNIIEGLNNRRRTGRSTPTILTGHGAQAGIGRMKT